MTGGVIRVGGTSHAAQGVIKALAPSDRRILAVTRRRARPGGRALAGRAERGDELRNRGGG